MVGAVLLSEIDETEFPKGTVLQSRDNDVIEYLDPQESAGADQVSGYSDVRLAGLGISPRMVVHQNDCVGGTHDRGSEDLASMYGDHVEDSCRYDVVALDPAPRGQKQGSERFSFGIKLRG